MNSIRETVFAIGVLLAGSLAISRCTACAGAGVRVKELEAEATYLGQNLECVDHLSTKEDIDGCRASVRKRWGITETIKDGGRE